MEDISKKVFESDPAWVGFGKNPGAYFNNRNAKKIAKYKPSVDYSQSESALLGYHLSKLLGNVGFVPHVTYRTMTVESMNAKAKQALDLLSQGENQGIKINKWMRDSWTSLVSGLRGNSSTVVAGDPKMSYGAIAVNPDGESDLDLFNHEYTKANFYKALQSSDSIAKSFSGLNSPKNSDEFKKAFQQLAYARDFSSAMMFDEITRQTDRFGNFSKVSRLHTIDAQGHINTKNSDSKDEKEAAANTEGIVLDRMLIKDNDDGLMSKGEARVHETLFKIRHFDPLVYSRLQWLAKLLKNPILETEVKNYFIKKVHLREKNYLKFKETLVKTADALEVNKNKLTFDLSMENYLKDGTTK